MFQIVWSIVAIGTMEWAGIVPPVSSEAHETFSAISQFSVTKLSVVVLLTVFVEEVSMRLIPLAAVIMIYSRIRATGPLVVVILVVSSVVFGLVHIGNFEVTETMKWWSLMFLILNHGVVGLIFGTLFLKISGLKTRYIIEAFLIAMIFHWVWDVTALLVARIASA